MTDTDSYLEVLRQEFDAEDGSFLLQLRVKYVWDKAAFTRLTEAMRVCCERHADAVTLERWLTEGFWYLYDFVRGHSTHPDFPRVYDEAYYAAAYERLWALASWFLMGLNPYLDGHGFEPL